MAFDQELFQAKLDHLRRIADGTQGSSLSTNDLVALRAVLHKLEYIEAAAAVVLEENEKLKTALQREGSR